MLQARRNSYQHLLLMQHNSRTHLKADAQTSTAPSGTGSKAQALVF
jgi:hypothetical protein